MEYFLKCKESAPTADSVQRFLKKDWQEVLEAYHDAGKKAEPK